MPLDPTDTVTIFSDTARSFCTWCEGASLGTEPEISAAAWLARLYAAALALPMVDSTYYGDPPNIPQAEYDAARNNLAHFNGWYYREFFDPEPDLDEAPCMGDVGDDLLDCYRDIRHGLLHFDAGQTNEALWHWSLLHKIHWGRHAVGAMFALHCLCISKREWPREPS